MPARRLPYAKCRADDRESVLNKKHMPEDFDRIYGNTLKEPDSCRNKHSLLPANS